MALNFPAKIYQILENESADIIRWLPNGAAFRIVDHGRFEREIIPKYFRHNQISSVQRQLNLYGFKCVSRGEDKGAFFHQKFRRGDWEIVKKITRYAPIKKPDELADPTRPDDLTLPHSHSPVQSESNSTGIPSVSAPSSNSNASHSSNHNDPHSLYQHHISAHAFQSYANTYHRPYDPYGYNEIPPFVPPHQSSEAASHSMYATGRRPPAWAWNGGPVPPHYANAYLMRQPMDHLSHTPVDHRNPVHSHAPAAKTDTTAPKTFNNAVTATPSFNLTTKNVTPTISNTEGSVSGNASVCSENSISTSKSTSMKDMQVVEPPKSTLKKTPSYLNIVNDVVLIDPDFDLGDEFDFFNEVVPAMKEMEASPYKPATETLQAPKQQARTSEIGVNTDLSQSAFLDYYSDI